MRAGSVQSWKTPLGVLDALAWLCLVELLRADAAEIVQGAMTSGSEMGERETRRRVELGPPRDTVHTRFAGAAGNREVPLP